MAILRRMVLIGLLATASLSCGCDLGSLVYFLMPDAKTDPELRRLASEDGKSEPRVVILVTRRGLETKPELIQAERELAAMICKQLKDQCAENKERLAIVAPRKVEEFKSAHPNWKALDPHDIAKHFDADYVVDLEINSISLYAKGTKELFQGTAEVRLMLYDMKNSDAQGDQRELTFSYPHEAHGGIPVFDSSVPAFRQKFLTYLAKRLAWNFTGHTPDEERAIDQ